MFRNACAGWSSSLNSDPYKQPFSKKWPMRVHDLAHHEVRKRAHRNVLQIPFIYVFQH